MIIRAHIEKAWVALLVLGVFCAACHNNAPVQARSDVIAFFNDTSAVRILSTEKQVFTVPTQRQSLQSTLRNERELWQVRKPREYRFLLRVGCFCPGTRGWLLIEVRAGKPLRAWDRTGKSVPLADWNTFSIDGLYDNLDRTANTDGEVRIAFDPRWHFPKFVNSVVLPGPDAWSTIEVRGLQAI
jgi:hypothetical protein